MRFVGCILLAIAVCVMLLKASAPPETSLSVAVMMGLLGGIGVWLVDQEPARRRSHLEMRLEKLIAPYRAVR